MGEHVIATATAIAQAMWGTEPEVPRRRRGLVDRLLRTGKFDGLVVTLEADGVIVDGALIHRVDKKLRVMFADGGSTPRDNSTSHRVRSWVCLPGQPLPGDWAFAEPAQFFRDGRHPTPTARISGGRQLMLGGAGRGRAAIDTPTCGLVVVFKSACGRHSQARRVVSRG